MIRSLSRRTTAAIILSTFAVFAAHSAEAGALRDRIIADAALDACGVDAARFCSGVIPGGGRIAVCLAEHQKRLSPDCRDFLESAEIARTAMFACAADAKRLCPGLRPGGGRIVRCLSDQRDRLSTGCDEALDAVMTEIDQ